MKKLLPIIMAMALAAAGCTTYPEIECSVPAKVVKGTIVTKTPARPEGQQHALKMKCEPIENVRIGLVGCGSRGCSSLDVLSHVEGCSIVAICDLYRDAVDNAREVLTANGITGVREFVGEDSYKQLCESEDIDLVYITTDWKMHTPIALYAMEHGKHAAAEVPSSTTLEECWQIVNACERTRKHFTILENCCYGPDEMINLYMKEKGAYGEIYFCEGAYSHDLNTNGAWPSYTDNWRLDFNQKHRGDVYPTHGLGPLCWLMDIHRGDRMKTLVAMDSDPVLSSQAAQKYMNEPAAAQGDHTVTRIRTENGHMISIQHNVFSGRLYSRIQEINGTKGFSRKNYVKYLRPEFLPDREEFRALVDKEGMVELDSLDKTRDLFYEVQGMYLHPLYKEYQKKAQEVGGHGGMDYIMSARLIYCLNKGLPLDEDVYDSVEWSCIGELSRISLNTGSMPVEVPDFTRGYWNTLKGLTFEYEQ